MKAFPSSPVAPQVRRFQRRAPYLMLAYGLSALGVLSAAPVLAQSAAPAGDSNASNSDKIETVVVTARKVKEKLQDVPLAISAFGSQALENAGVRSLQDLSQLTPGMTLSGAGTQSNVPTIRGQGSLSAFTDPNVAIFLDGIYMNNSSAVSLGLIDMERIEVVEGPVSALYGRNAFAGAVNYVSKKPTDKTEGSVAVNFGGGGMKQSTMSVGGALIPGLLRARVALGVENYEGTHQDPVNHLYAGGDRQRDGQVSVDFTPTKELDIEASFYRGVDRFQDSATTYSNNNCGTKTTAGEYTNYCGQINTNQHPVEVSAISPSAGLSGNQRYVTAAHLKASYDLGWGDISGLYGYNQVNQSRVVNFNARRDGITFPLVGGGTTALPVYFGSLNNSDDQSIELRLASKQNQRARWSTGLYGFNATRTTANLTSVDATTLPPGSTVAYIYGFGKYQSADGSINQAAETPAVATDKIKSGFVGGEYDIIPTVTASAEVRRTIQSKSQIQEVYNAANNTFVQNGARQYAGYLYNNFRTTLNWKPYAGATYYASVANGTKAGGFNSLATIQSEVAYAPETNKTFEIGSKNTLLDGRLQVNVAVFNIKSKNLQINGPSDDPSNVTVVTKNFGSAKTNGIELNVIGKPMRGLTLNGGVAYVDPKFDGTTLDYTAANIATCQLVASCVGRIVTVSSAHGPVQAINLNGNAPPRASKLTVTLGAEIYHRVTEDWTWFGRIDGNYRSKQYFNQDNLSWWGPQHTFNLHTGLENDSYKVTLYVKNLTNNQVPSVVLQNSRLSDLVPEMISYLPEERTIGITASYKF